MKKLIKHLFLIGLALIMIFPFVFVMLGSSNDSGWAFHQPFVFIFGEDFLKNILKLVNNHNLAGVTLNSLVSSVGTAFLSVIVITLAAFASAKYEFRGKKVLLLILAGLLVIPEPSYLIGQLLVINKLNLYSTMAGLIVPFIVNVRMFFYLKEAMTFIEDPLLDAGRVDGASEFKVMLRIALPQVFDKIILAFFLIFIASWNNFLIPMIISNKGDLFTLPILISSLADDMRYDLGAVFMALLISIIPVLLIYSLIQHKIIDKNTGS